MELVTGRSGKPHITSQQVRQLQQGIFGANACILNTGSMLTPEVQSSSKIRIKDGALMFQGALFTVKVGGYDEVTINNGNQGMKRKDVIAVKYTYDSSRNIESGEWAVVQGTPAASNPAVPSMPVTDGDIQAGDAEVYCPVFVINLDGINVTGVDIIPPMMDDMSTINKYLSELQVKLAGYEYSRDEQVIGKWIDGRNLYRKVIMVGNIKPNATETTMPHGVENIDRVIHLYGSARNTNLDSRFTIGLPYPSVKSGNVAMSLQANDEKIMIYTSQTSTPYSAIVVMEYIKKSD